MALLNIVIINPLLAYQSDEGFVPPVPPHVFTGQIQPLVPFPFAAGVTVCTHPA